MVDDQERDLADPAAGDRRGELFEDGQGEQVVVHAQTLQNPHKRVKSGPAGHAPARARLRHGGS
ncbi:hypothetical protein Slala05_42500 [Streptomyces lavendulae subsp. lavendulae]|nr:hypothetical protein Slala05_42500 [Streptomyces lavendulae subsp. lavendulae]